MRMLYLTLGLFLLLDIGAVCRSPSTLPAGCEPASGGLAHCGPPSGVYGE